MAVGRLYWLPDGMLLNTLENVDMDGDGSIDGFLLQLRNQFYHGSNPVGWIRKLEVTLDQAPVPTEDVLFGLRGQWLCTANLASVTDIWWNQCETASLYVKKRGGAAPGEHTLECVLTVSAPFNKRTVDRLNFVRCLTVSLRSTAAVVGPLAGGKP